MKAVRDLRAALGQDEPVEVSAPKRARSPPQLVGTEYFALDDTMERPGKPGFAPSRAELELAKEVAERAEDRQAAVSAIEAEAAKTNSVYARLATA